jgi:hypothetical protein
LHFFRNHLTVTPCDGFGGILLGFRPDSVGAFCSLVAPVKKSSLAQTFYLWQAMSV